MPELRLAKSSSEVLKRADCAFCIARASFIAARVCALGIRLLRRWALERMVC